MKLFPGYFNQFPCFSQGFVHPGLLHTRRQLDLIKTKVAPALAGRLQQTRIESAGKL